MKIKVKPRPPQITGASFLVSKRNGLCIYTTGSGKSLIQILMGFRFIKDKKLDKFILAVTKTSFIEVRKDFRDLTDYEPYHIKDYNGFKAFIESEKKIAIIQYTRMQKIIPYVNAKIGFDKQRLRELYYSLKGIRIGVAYDEVDTLKNPRSRLSRTWAMFRCFVCAQYGFTATPVNANIYDLFEIVNFLQPGKLGTWQEFTDNYIIRKRKIIRVKGGKRRIWEVVGFKNLETMNKVLDDFMITYFPKQDLEFKHESAPLVDWETYKTAAEGFLRSKVEKYQDEGRESDAATTHSVRLIDLQMVVNNDQAKKDLFLKAVKKRLDQGVIVFCSFYFSLDICKEIMDNNNIDHREITGKQVKIEDREASKEWFIQDPTNKVLFITLAGGRSLNLQATPHIIFFDIPFGVGKFSQVMGRVVREFSSFRKFIITFILADSTIDLYKYELITLHRELFLKLFRNEMLPSGLRSVKMNAHIVKRLKKDLLWVDKKTK